MDKAWLSPSMFGAGLLLWKLGTDGLQVLLRVKRGPRVLAPRSAESEPLFKEQKQNFKFWLDHWHEWVVHHPFLIKANACFYILLRKPLGSPSPAEALRVEEGTHLAQGWLGLSSRVGAAGDHLGLPEVGAFLRVQPGASEGGAEGVWGQCSAAP